MIIISYNYRGIGNQRAVGVLTKLVRKKGSTVLFLMAIKRSIVEMRKLCFYLNFQSALAIPSDRHSGGLGMFWKLACNLHI